MRRVTIVTLLGVGLALTGCSSNSSSPSASTSTCTPSADFSTVSPGVLTVAGFISPPSVTNVDGSRDALGGMDADVVHEFAAAQCLDVSEHTTSVSAGVGDLDSGRIDILIGGVGYTPERGAAFGTSTPMYSLKMATLSSTGVSTIDAMGAGNGVGVVQGYRWQEDLQKALGDKVKVYQSQQAMLSDLQAGRIDAATLDSGEAAYFKQQLGGDWTVAVVEPDKRVAATESPSQVVILFGKKNIALGMALDGTIATMASSGELAQLQQKYGLDPVK